MKPQGMTDEDVKLHYAGPCAPTITPDMRECKRCGTWAKPNALHYPGNDPEIDAAHRQVDVDVHGPACDCDQCCTEAGEEE